MEIDGVHHTGGIKIASNGSLIPKKEQTQYLGASLWLSQEFFLCGVSPKLSGTNVGKKKQQTSSKTER